MQIDQRFVQGLQNDNTNMRQEINRLNAVAKSLDEKYQKCLKEMSSIIHANQNLKQELDNLKAGAKDQIQNTQKELRANYEKRIEAMIIQKNDLYVESQNILREKQQLQRSYSQLERSQWEAEALKTEVTALKKQNEKLLLQTHPLTQNQDNPEHKLTEQKLSQKIQQLNAKIIELNVQNTQSRKYNDSLEVEKSNLQRQVDGLNKKTNDLNAVIERLTSQNKNEAKVENESLATQTKRQQMQTLELRKANAALTNELQKLKLEKLEMASGINKNEAQMHLLQTLKSLHSQLQPMRYEIEELKRDKYFERESTNKQKAQMQMKLLSSEHELETLRQYIKQIESRSKQLGTQLKEKQWQRYKFQELQQEKRILEGRVIVYEAMEMVTRNREKPHHIQRIQEFERRIQILLQEENLQYLVNNANVHQLIAMKAYVIELDNKLQAVAEQNEHLNKRYGQYKQKYQLLISENKQIVNKHYSMINAYKGKIAGYQKLVIKLTDELEKYIKDSQGPSSVQSHYKSVITLYESKILSIYNEANAKKQENRDLSKKLENLELEFKGKVALIRQYEIELNNLKAKNKQLSTRLTTRTIDEQQKVSSNSIPQDHYKKIISQKTRQILELQESISKLKLQLDRMQFEHDRNVDNYKHRINRLEIEIDQLRLEQAESNKQLSSIKHSEEFGELVAKLSILEKNVVAMSKSQVSQQNSQSPINNKDDSDRRLQTLTRQNQFLNKELQNLRRRSQQLPVTASNQDELNKIKDMANRTIREMENRIYELEAELKVKTKQLQIKDRQIERVSEKDESPQKFKDATNLQQENKILRVQLDRIKVSYRSMTQQSEGLMNKIKQTQAYIARLKDQFDLVCNKMSEYERQLGSKDKQVHELRLKLTSLQEQYTLQIRNAKMSVDPANNKQIQQKLRKIKQNQLQLERAHREIESKLRDIQRRDMEVSRRESEFQIKNRDFKDRIKKVEQRQRIVSEEQNRLIALSHRLEEMERKLVSITPPPPSIEISPPKFEPSFKQQFHDLERKYKRLEIQLTEKLKILEIKQQKSNKMIKEKAQLTKQNQQLKAALDEKSRQLQTTERQLINLKNQCSRLEGELEKLWKEFDMLKQQIRNKDRQISDAQLERDEAKKKYELEVRRVKQLENSKTTPVAALPSPSKSTGPDYNQLEKQFEERIKQMDQRYKLKIKQLYAQNEQNMRDQQQIIFDLNAQISRLRTSNNSQTNKQIDSHTATMRSLESHIKILQQELQRKNSLISQLEEDAKYYKQLLSQREDQLQKMYESTRMPSSQGEQDSLQRKRLQNQIIALQNMIQSRSQSTENHDQCIKKEHLLRMEIERLSGILQSKISDQASQKPQSPRSNYLDNSYLNDLEETNKSLEIDLNQLKQRLIADFDTKRTIDEYLAIMVLTFAQVDALRQRVYELQQNFKQQHEREMNVIKQIDNLKEHDIDVQKILSIIKQLQVAHRTFHEEQQRSKSTFIKRINTELLVMPGSQALSINEEINKQKIGQSQMRRLDLGVNNPTYFGERSIANGLMEDSQFANNSVSNLMGGQNTYSSIPLSNFRPAPPTSQIYVTNQQYSSNTGYIGSSGLNAPLINMNFGKVENSGMMNSIHTTNLSQQRPSSFGNEGLSTMIGRQSNFTSSMNQSIPISGSPSRYMEGSSFNRTQQYQPNKALQPTQPYRFYQPSEASESSVRFPSQTNIRLPGAPMIINSSEKPPAAFFTTGSQFRNRF